MNKLGKIGGASILLLLGYFNPLLAKEVQANCRVLNELAETSLNSTTDNASRTVCLEVQNLITEKTVINLSGIHKSGNITYKAVVKNASMTVILDKTITATGFDTLLNLNGHDSVFIYLTPLNGKYLFDFKFNVINYNEQRRFGVINVAGLISEPTSPPEGPPCSRCNQQRSNLIGNANGYSSMVSVNSTEAAQCNDSNRPPHSPPVDSTTGQTFNYNQTFQQTEAAYGSLQSKYGAPVAEVMAFIDMYEMHKTGGRFDVKSSYSDYYDASLPSGYAADNGNFLFGGRMASYGFSEMFTLRASAAYQAISDHGWLGLQLGVFNFVFNVGDNRGDPASVSRGWTYKTEVHANNRYDSSSSSCRDQDTADASSGNPGSGGSGGGGSGGSAGGGSGGGMIGVGGGSGSGETWWCMVQDGYPTHCWQE